MGVTYLPRWRRFPVSWQMLAEIFLLIARLRAPSAPPMKGADAVSTPARVREARFAVGKDIT
jgi:hypothetical protein